MGWTSYEIEWARDGIAWKFRNSAGDIFTMTLQDTDSPENVGRYGTLPDPSTMEDGEFGVVQASQVVWDDVGVLSESGAYTVPHPTDYEPVPWEILMAYDATGHGRKLLCAKRSEGITPISDIYFWPHLRGGEAGEIRLMAFYFLGGFVPCVCDGVHGWWSIVYYFWV